MMISYPTLKKILESRLDTAHADYEQDDKTGKLTARLKGYDSQVYTKLGKKIERLTELEKEIKKLKDEVKAETKEHIGDLFSATDAVFTRVVETKSFIFTLSKDPKPTESPKYKEILTALEEHLTPQLIKILNKLKKELKTVTQKQPSLRVDPVVGEALDLGSGVRTIASHLSDLWKRIARWARRFDAELNRLKRLADEAREDGNRIAAGKGYE